MLILSVDPGHKVYIGTTGGYVENITDDRVRLGFEFPRHIPIERDDCGVKTRKQPMTDDEAWAELDVDPGTPGTGIGVIGQGQRDARQGKTEKKPRAKRARNIPWEG